MARQSLELHEKLEKGHIMVPIRKTITGAAFGTLQGALDASTSKSFMGVSLPDWIAIGLDVVGIAALMTSDSEPLRAIAGDMVTSESAILTYKHVGPQVGTLIHGRIVPQKRTLNRINNAKNPPAIPQVSSPFGFSPFSAAP